MNHEPPQTASKYIQDAELLNRTEGGSRRRKSCIRVAAIVESTDPWWRDLLSPEVRQRLEAREGKVNRHG